MKCEQCQWSQFWPCSDEKPCCECPDDSCNSRQCDYDPDAVDNDSIRPFSFKKNGRLLFTMHCNFTEARRTGNETAEEHGPVQVFCYTFSPLYRWEELGTFHGNMRYTAVNGVEYIINKDFSAMTKSTDKTLKS